MLDIPIYKNSPGRPRKKRRKGVERVCLKCDKVFLSRDRILNRLCPACNEVNSQLSLMAEGKRGDDSADWIMDGSF